MKDRPGFHPKNSMFIGSIEYGSAFDALFVIFAENRIITKRLSEGSKYIYPEELISYEENNFIIKGLIAEDNIRKYYKITRPNLTTGGLIFERHDLKPFDMKDYTRILTALNSISTVSVDNETGVLLSHDDMVEAVKFFGKTFGVSINAGTGAAKTT